MFRGGPPGGITFNQFLLVDDEPVLIHTGMRMHFAELLDGVNGVITPGRLRWITSNHASRPDELGALDSWFAAAPNASVVHGDVACRVNLTEVADERRRPMADGDVIHTGRLRCAGSRRRMCPVRGKPASGSRRPPASCSPATSSHTQALPAVTADDIVDPAVTHDTRAGATALTPTTGVGAAEPRRPTPGGPGAHARPDLQRWQ